MKKNLILALTVCSALVGYAQSETPPAEESISTELQEVVVTSENVWIEGNKVVFRPKKSAKNLATDATSLVERMHTGILHVENGKIKARGGEDVAIFINGVRADDIDLSTFWPKNALRVEYMESSNDPQFQGQRNILNFIMKDYVAGGLTKLNGSQTFPNQGNYSVSSKLVMGKMTYNAMFKGGYSRDHQSGSSQQEQFRDIWYDGEHYDLINIERDEKSYNRSNELYAGANARYRSGNTIIVHNIGWQWRENPGSGSAGSIMYTPGVIAADRMNSYSKNRSISPTVGGQYSFSHKKWSYLFAWGLEHSHNNNYSLYADLGLDPIQTRVKENYYNIAAGVMVSYSMRNNMMFQLMLRENRKTSDANYSGTTASHQWQGIGWTNIKLVWWYRPCPKVAISLTPQMSINDWNINHSVKKTEWMPGVDLRLGWSLNRKNIINFQAWYVQGAPASSMRTDLILRQTELKWLQGNPILKGNDMYWLSLNYTTYPLSWLNTSMDVSYITDNSESAIFYRSGGESYDGVIGEYINAGRRNAFQGQWDITANLFNGNVSVSSSLTYSLTDYANLSTVAFWRWRPSASWNFGNCSLSLYYYGPEKEIANGGTKIIKTPDGYGLDFTYGNGNLVARLSLNQIFNKHSTTTSTLISGPYSVIDKSWVNGRSIGVSLTYTFDYGKKVDPGVDIYEQEIQSTSVLGSGK